VVLKARTGGMLREKSFVETDREVLCFFVAPPLDSGACLLGSNPSL
jgi:hypothetical protein